ncbi:unnamed protein product [Ambrosiozyma monospora]|uniref:Unnamed protein product n=1 Tax=Ambrosiozyma monospora TaxID=43982 RepID=A0ACB5T4Q4_AMBMO|nr:unnamed protein product [Ambrosiozyma monospora]
MSSKSIKKLTQPKNILELPDEILLLIFSFLLDDQSSLVKSLYVSKRFHDMSKEILYSKPYFTSTYRVAQFVNTICQNRELALKVKVLDLSHLRMGVDLEEDQTVDDLDDKTEILGGWREFKYRNHPLYGLRKPISGGMGSYNRQSDRNRSISSMNSLFSNSNDSTNTFNESLSPIPSRIRADHSRSRSRSRSRSDTHVSTKSGKSGLFSNKIKKAFKHDEYDNFNFVPDLSDLYHSFDATSNTKKHFFSKSSGRWKGYNSRINHEQQVMTNALIPLVKRRPFTSPHPLQNRFLHQYSFSKDLPIGFVLHMLQNCENLEVVDFTGLSYSVDFEFTDFQYFDWERSKGITYKDNPISRFTACNYGSLLLDVGSKDDQIARERQRLEQFAVHCPVYWSDTTREIDYNEEANFKKLNTDSIWEAMIHLKNLKKIKLCSLVWLKLEIVQQLLTQSESLATLKCIDCTDSGMIKGAGWARSRTLREWRMFFRDDSKRPRRRRRPIVL